MHAETNPDLSKLQLPIHNGRMLFLDAEDPIYQEQKPFYSNIPFLHTGAANSNVKTVEVEVPLADIRGHEGKLDLDKNGFELTHWKHEFVDLGSSIPENAYPAVRALLKSKLGEHVRVAVFDHTVRQPWPEPL